MELSIVVPLLNEQESLQEPYDWIADVMRSNRFSYELIFVDDDSKDGSSALLENFLAAQDIKYRIISNARTSGSPKKDAIRSAINIAKFDWIVTTDADCELPEYWLYTMDQFIQNNEVKFIVAPVTYRHIDSFFDRFHDPNVLELHWIDR